MTSSLPGTTRATATRTARARRSLRAVAAASIGALLGVTGGGAALADDLVNTLDTTIDGDLEVVPLNVKGPARTVELYVVPVTGQDGTPGCNLTPGTAYTVDVVPTRAGIVEVSPTSLTFTSCADRPTITVRALAQGLTNVRLEQRSNTTAGTFRVAGAAFSVPVGAALPNTAPTVAVTGVQGGATYTVGDVPDAGCAATDAEDGPSSSPATLGPVVWPSGMEGLGSQSATCTYTDADGVAATASVTFAVADPTAPWVAGELLADPDGQDGWYTGDVPVRWTVDEPESAESLVVDGCTDDAITQDGDAVTSRCTATSAGGTTTQSLTVRRDATAPTVAVAGTTGTQGRDGWYTSPVTVTFEAQDATSGPATGPQSVTTTGEGGALTLTSPDFADNAGNITPAGAATATVAVDLTNPGVTFDRMVPLTVFGKVPAAPACTATDAGSGPAGCVVTGYATTVGTHTLTATATDRAGRTATATQSYLVLPWLARGFAQPVDMGGVLNVTKAGSTVPVKFELYAGLSKVTSTSAVTMTSKPIACSTKARTDTVETVTTGSSALTYDSRAGGFLYKWKTPSQAGTCQRLTMTAADGTTLSADFRLK